MHFLIVVLLILPAQTDLNTVLKDHYEAVGQQYLSQFRTAIISGRVIRDNQEGFDYTTYIKRPDKVRRESVFSNETVVRAFNGSDGWHKDFNNLLPLSAGDIRELRNYGQFDSYFYTLEQSGKNMTYLGRKTIVNDDYHQIRVTQPEGNTDYFIDVSTNLLYRIREGVNKSENEVTEITFLNYRKFGPVRLPMIINRDNAKGRVQTFVDEIAFDVAVSNELFEKPK